MASNGVGVGFNDRKRDFHLDPPFRWKRESLHPCQMQMRNPSARFANLVHRCLMRFDANQVHIRLSELRRFTRRIRNACGPCLPQA